MIRRCKGRIGSPNLDEAASLPSLSQIGRERRWQFYIQVPWTPQLERLRQFEQVQIIGQLRNFHTPITDSLLPLLAQTLSVETTYFSAENFELAEEAVLIEILVAEFKSINPGFGTQ